MTVNLIAFVLTAIVSILVPLIIFGIVIKKCEMERVGVTISFFLGVFIYVVTQWGIKQHVLTYLYNHTDFAKWVGRSYITYLLVVALGGSLLMVFSCMLITVLGYKKQVSYAKAFMMGLGYAMAEAVMLVGYSCVFTIISILKGEVEKVTTSTFELYLAVYERILFMIIYIAIMVGLIYLIEQKMNVRGIIISGSICTMINFLPGFFIAFTTKNYNETFDRPVALLFSDIILTMAGITSIVVLLALRYSLKDEHVDSKQAVIAFNKKKEEKNKKKDQKKKK